MQWWIWISLIVWKPLFFIWMKISQVVASDGLGEDQNISLSTESWKINNRWKTLSAVRRIAKFLTAIEIFLNSDQRCSPLLCRRFRVSVCYGTTTMKNLVFWSPDHFVAWSFDRKSSGFRFRWLAFWISDHWQRVLVARASNRRQISG